MQIDQWNRTAAKALLADTERVLALAQVEDLQDVRGVAKETIANAHKNYIDLIRRSGPLIMSDADLITLQRLLDRIRAFLHFFGESV